MIQPRESDEREKGSLIAPNNAQVAPRFGSGTLGLLGLGLD